jgi:hypothetical protein
MAGELHTPAFDVDVWTALSLLTHVTVVPAGMSTGFGAYAVVVSLDAPFTIVAVIAGPVADGPDGDGPWPHPIIRRNASTAITLARINTIFTSRPEANTQRRCPS